MRDPIVGIDLGTSNSVVAYADATGSVKVLADDAGGKVHPSVVSFHPNGGVVVGAAAKQRKVIDPKNTIYSVKRLIGRAYNSPEVQTAKQRSPFTIQEGQNNAPMIATRGGEFAVPEISAIVLDHVRHVAAARLEVPVNRAVVTVPASFNDAQRSATATAGAIAGLTVVRVLNEPTAAALAYGHTRNLREIIAVYDFGGGTFDITFLKLEDQVYEVLGTSGDTFLGGDDLDERLVEKMVAKFLAENRMDLRTHEVAMMRLRAVAEQTKIELSRRSRAVVRIDEIAYGPRGAPLNLQIEISRDEFVREVADLIDRTFPVCAEAMALAQLRLDQIADVILVGGSTKIPYVRDQVAKFFGKPARTDVNPEDAVAAGAALQATSLERILSKRPSSRLSVASADDTEQVANALKHADAETGATMAPSELTLTPRPKRPTASYADQRRPPTDATKPDTSYRVTRGGVRDAVAEPERYPGAPLTSAQASTASGSIELDGETTNTRGTFSQTQPLGRITRQQSTVQPPTHIGPAPAPPPPIPSVVVAQQSAPMPAPHLAPGVPPPLPHQAKTVFGVPAAPLPPTASGPTHATVGGVPAAFELELESGALSADTPFARPPTATGMASPPPVPRRAPPRVPEPHQVTAPLPRELRAPEPTSDLLGDSADASWGGDSTADAGWSLDTPATVPSAPFPPPLAPSGPFPPPLAPSGPFPPPLAPSAPPSAKTMVAATPPAPAAPSPATTMRGMPAPSAPPPIMNPAAKGFVPTPGPRSLTPTPPPPIAAMNQGAYDLSAFDQDAGYELPDDGAQPLYGTAPRAQPLGYAAPPQGYPPPQAPQGYAQMPAAPQGYAQMPVAPQGYVPPPATIPPPVAARPAPLLIEVTPRALGIATVAGFCEELIRRNARVPTEARKLFSTSRDRQDVVRIVVCQGESRRLDNNTVIGEVILQGLPPRPRGETTIEVTFALDGAGTLQVRARDTQTGTEQRATLFLVGDVPQEDIAASRDRLQQLRR